MKAISLFTGAGGLDNGFEAAGFTICVGVDNDADSCATIRANKLWPILYKDIHRTTSKEILDTGCLKKDDVDLLVGGPPCQPFSKSAYWVNGDTKRLNDQRADTILAYMRCVEDFLPKVFILENVHGINYSGKEEGFLLVEKLTKNINRKHGTDYCFAWNVVNAADYGVPQLRKRFFLVAHRDGVVFNFPTPTHSPETYMTAWDAIGGLSGDSLEENLQIKGRWADLMPSIPEGENYLWHTRKRGGLPLFGWRTRYWSFLLKLAKNSPSWTIQAQPGPAIGPFHWTNRLLSVKEMARLQTFPPDFIFSGNRNAIQRQIGNAVPSLLGEVLARAMANQFWGVSITHKPNLAIEPKRPIPQPESTMPVSEKYHYLIGDHADHPGIGKGASARKRIKSESVAMG